VIRNSTAWDSPVSFPKIAIQLNDSMSQIVSTTLTRVRGTLLLLPTLRSALHYRTVAIPSLAFQVVSDSSSDRISITPSFSESPPSESQEFMMHQIMRMVTIPEEAPTQARIRVVAFWKLNSNRATKNTQTLSKLVIVNLETVEPGMRRRTTTSA
jgi:hypothetical protein